MEFLGIGSLLLLAACEFRNPDDGYDPNWKPDHEATAENDAPEASLPASAEADKGLHNPSATQEHPRPAQIAADTAAMQKTWDTWEMVGVEKSEFTAYFQKRKLAMIVEKTPESTRSYYFDGGALFYFNEKSDDGSAVLTVEFDDIGDVQGARKTINGNPARPDSDDYSEIVEHAVELKIAAEE